MKRAAGFTLIELVVTLALVGLMAYISTPLYEVTMTRVREAELRSALRQIRVALDAYKTAADAGVIAKRANESGYPGSLELRVPVKRCRPRRRTPAGGRVVTASFLGGSLAVTTTAESWRSDEGVRQREVTERAGVGTASPSWRRIPSACSVWPWAERTAVVVDHIRAAKGDEDLFRDESNHRELCKPCHDARTEEGDFGR